MAVTFDAVVQLRGINPFVRVTAEQAAAIRADWRRAMPVLVTVDGQPATPWHINLMPAGDGSFYLYLHQIVRSAAGCAVGDRVAVRIAFDHDHQTGPAHPMPAVLRAGLKRNRIAQRNWDRLPASRQKEILRYYAQLKSIEARARHLERALSVLRGHSGRFMARSWSKGR